MDFVSAIWGENYATCGRGMIRAFGRYCQAHRLIVHTDVPELLPELDESRNVVYQIDRREDWLANWPGYYNTANRQMIVKLSLLEKHLPAGVDQRVSWVDADTLLLDDPEADLGLSKDVKLVVDGDGAVSGALWGVSSFFQLRDLRQFALERAKGHDFIEKGDEPVLALYGGRMPITLIGGPQRVFEPGARQTERLRPSGDLPGLFYFKNGGVFLPGRRLVSLRLSRALVEEHQATKWRGFRDANVRGILQELYRG